MRVLLLEDDMILSEIITEYLETLGDEVSVAYNGNEAEDNNLLSNAIKYNKLGGEIEVTTKGQTLIIKDSGIGIAKEHQSEIYKRFYRATDESGGFGLGLNIVYKICKTYDIDINMESQYGKGTEFWLEFKR